MAEYKGGVGTKQIFSDTILWSVTTVMLVIPGIVRTKIASTHYGLEELGLFGQLSQLQTMLLVLGVGGFTTASKTILGRLRSNSIIKPQIQSWLTLSPVAISITFVLICVPFLEQISIFISGENYFEIAVLVSLVGVPFGVFAQQSLSAAQADRDSKNLLFAGLTAAVISSITTSFLMLTGEIHYGIFSLVSAPFIQAIVIAVICPSVRRNLLVRPQISKEIKGEALHIALSSAILGSGAAFTELYLRSELVASFGLEAVSAYLPVVLLVTQAFGLILSPLSSSTMVSLTKTNKTESAALLTNLMKTSLPVVFSLAGVCLAFSPILVSIFFTNSLFQQALPLLAVAYSGEIFRALMWLLGAPLLPLKDRYAWLFIGLITVGVQLGSGLLLLPIFGNVALPLAYSIGSLVGCSLLIWRLHQLDYLPKISSYVFVPVLSVLLYFSFLIPSPIGAIVLIGPLAVTTILILVIYHSHLLSFVITRFNLGKSGQL